jgi:hypothetical protein
MNNDEVAGLNAWNRGCRAEEVVRFYLKLQGFFTLVNLALHKERPSRDLKTEADLLAMRLEHSCEHIANRRLKDCEKLRGVIDAKGRRIFLIAEIKSSACAINEAWDYRCEDSDAAEHYHYAIKKLGFCNASDARQVSITVAEKGRWKDDNTVVQFICFGKTHSPNLERSQILFSDIATFLTERFTNNLSPKIPERANALIAWGEFGHGAAKFFQGRFGYRPITHGPKSIANNLDTAIENYIRTGHFED